MGLLASVDEVDDVARTPGFRYAKENQGVYTGISATSSPPSTHLREDSYGEGLV